MEALDIWRSFKNDGVSEVTSPAAVWCDELGVARHTRGLTGVQEARINGDGRHKDRHGRTTENGKQVLAQAGKPRRTLNEGQAGQHEVQMSQLQGRFPLRGRIGDQGSIVSFGP